MSIPYSPEDGPVEDFWDSKRDLYVVKHSINKAPN